MLGVFGGSFDPVHNGHLQVARDVANALGLEELRFVPCHIPPHKDGLQASAAQRIAMLDIALAGDARCVVDPRETARNSPSYSYETLADLRRERGQAESINFILGWDSWQNLNSWYRWQDLFELCNFAVVARPGCQESVADEVGQYVKAREVEPGELRGFSHGRYARIATEPVDASATQIRDAICRAQWQALPVPPKVMAYIREQKLYQSHLWR